MLSGMVKPSSGTARVFGHDIRTDFSSASKFIGPCPQHSILYNSLTPREHLMFYGKLKSNLKSKALQAEIYRYVPLAFICIP